MGLINTTPKRINIETGGKDTHEVVIEKTIGPAVFSDIKIIADNHAYEWVVYRNDAIGILAEGDEKTAETWERWVEVSRFPCQDEETANLYESILEGN